VLRAALVRVVVPALRPDDARARPFPLVPSAMRHSVGGPSRPPSEVGGPRSGGPGREWERRRIAQTYRSVFTIVSLSLPDESVVKPSLM